MNELRDGTLTTSEVQMANYFSIDDITVYRHHWSQWRYWWGLVCLSRFLL